MQSSPFRSFRGMQVHAVPDSDKAFDASGRKLPWGYDFDPAHSENREPVEKGPFGRSQRRSRSGLSRSRSKTAEPRREEDRIRAEQQAAEDAVFGSLRKKGDREALGEVDINAAGQQAQQQLPSVGKGEVEATEVLLYGFGEELQWAALDLYERVSGGTILEDYDRQPPNHRYNASRSLSRATSQRGLTKAALKKKNRFAGGLHWIKITFDSRAAADLACARSPHTIKGHLVYAEPYLGRGPGKDEPIVATMAGAQITDDVLPTTFSTSALNPVVEGSPNGSSTTATSATATTRQQEGTQQRSNSSSALPDPFTTRTPSTSAITPASINNNTMQLSQSSHSGTLRHRPSQGRLISGATKATIIPTALTFQPKQPKPSWGTWLFGGGEVIGSTVPKKEDGGFDNERAGMYWKVFWLIDSWCATDLCGLRGE